MTLGEYIKKYREEHKMSQRDFAKVSGFSNGYISMLEKNENPKTHKPITVTLDTLKQLADVMGLSIDAMLQLVDDMPVDLGPSNAPKRGKIKQINELLEKATPDQLAAVTTFIKMMIADSHSEE